MSPCKPRTVPYALAAACLVLVGTAGCVDMLPWSEPTPGPSEITGGPRATPSTSPTMPAIPDSARARNAAGANSFAMHYYAVVEYGHRTGDWRPLKALSLPTCTQCEAFWTPSPARFLPRAHIEASDPETHVEGSEPYVDMTITAVPGLRTPAVGASPTPADEQTWNDELHLRYLGNVWKVVEIEVTDVLRPAS